MQLLNFSRKLAIYAAVDVLAITDMQECGLHVLAGLMQAQQLQVNRQCLGRTPCCSSQELQGFLAKLTQ